MHPTPTRLGAALLGALTLALGGCSTMTVSADWDQAVDFAPLRTYKWGKSAAPDDPPWPPSMLVVKSSGLSSVLCARSLATYLAGSQYMTWLSL